MDSSDDVPTFLKRANLTRLGTILSLMSIVGAGALLACFLSWSLLSHGFQVGYEVGKNENTVADVIFETLIGALGRSTYEGLAEDYRYLGLLAFGSLMLSGVRLFLRRSKTGLILGIANVFLLLLILSNLRWMLGLKDPAANESLGSEYYALLRESVLYDWVSICIVGALMVAELLSLVVHLRHKRIELSQ